MRNIKRMLEENITVEIGGTKPTIWNELWFIFRGTISVNLRDSLRLCILAGIRNSQPKA